MEEDDKGCPMIRMGVSGWMFLLVPAYLRSPGQKAVKRLCVCVHVCCVHFCGNEDCGVLRFLCWYAFMSGAKKQKWVKFRRPIAVVIGSFWHCFVWRCVTCWTLVVPPARLARHLPHCSKVLIFAVPFPGKHARGWVILCDPIWHVSSRRDEACCEVVRSVYLTYTALSFCA